MNQEKVVEIWELQLKRTTQKIKTSIVILKQKTGEKPNNNWRRTTHLLKEYYNQWWCTKNIYNNFLVCFKPFSQLNPSMNETTQEDKKKNYIKATKGAIIKLPMKQLQEFCNLGENNYIKNYTSRRLLSLVCYDDQFWYTLIWCFRKKIQGTCYTTIIGENYTLHLNNLFQYYNERRPIEDSSEQEIKKKMKHVIQSWEWHQ